MEITRSVHEGSALIICMVVMMAVTMLFACIHVRLYFLSATVSAYEQSTQLQASADAFAECILEHACAHWSYYSSQQQIHEQTIWPLLSTACTGQGVVLYQRMYDNGQPVLQIMMKLICNKQVCTRDVKVRVGYDPITGLINKYHIYDWHIG